MQKKIRLGELLIQKKIISLEQLNSALEQQRRCGYKLGRILTESGVVTEVQISEAVATQLDIHYIDLDYYNIHQDCIRQLPENRARQFRAIILRVRGSMTLVGMSDPADVFACNELKRILECDIEIAAVTETCLFEVISRNYLAVEL